MKHIIHITLYFWVFAGFSIANLPEDPKEYAEWKASSLAKIYALENTPSDVAIPVLGLWVFKLSTGMNIEKGDRSVFHSAQNLLLSKPGHAKFYQDEIERLRSEVVENSKKNSEEIIAMKEAGRQLIHRGNYTEFMVRSMQTLRCLPSPETVAVLGHFLNDPEGRDGKMLLGEDRVKPGDDFSSRAINCEQACLAIREVGIEHAPSKVPEGHWLAKASLSVGEVDSWKDWWNEVKDNKRSYRFIGSNIDYGPDGPASKEQIERSNLKQLRDTERELGVRKPRADPAIIAFTKPSIHATVLTACVFGIVVVWCFLKNRNQ